MIRICIMSCSCAKDAPCLLCEFDAAQSRYPPLKHCLWCMLLRYVSESSEVMPKGTQFRSKDSMCTYLN